MSLTVFDYCLRCCSTPSSLCLSRSISSACFTSTYLSSCLSPPLCVLSALHFFLLSIFPAFLFPTSLVAVPSSFSFPSRQAVLCYDAQTLLGQPVRPWWADWLDCLLSSILVLTDHLRLPGSRWGETTQDTEDRKGIKAGSHPAYPNC